MRRIVLFIFLIISLYAHNQVSGADLKKISKIFSGTQLFDEKTKVQSIDSTSIPGYYDRSMGLGWYREGEPVLTFVTLKPVMLDEYDEFRKWVIDSVFREQIYLRMVGDEEVSEYIVFDDYYGDEGGLEAVEFDPSDRELNRALFPLNYDKKLKYNDLYSGASVILSMYHIPFIKEFYRKMEVNERLITYRYHYKLKEKKGPSGPGKRLVTDDTTDILYNFKPWVELSKHPYDCYSVLTQIYPDLTSFNVPATGINLHQAEAFCIWKAEQINKELNEKKLDFKVDVRIASVNEMSRNILCETELPVPLKNKTPDWAITKKDYTEFWKSIKDSVLRECLFTKVSSDEHSIALLDYQYVYLDHGALEWVDIDPSDRLVNRYFFPFDYSTNTAKYRKDESCSTCFNALDSISSLTFKYFYRNIKELDLKTAKPVIVPRTVNVTNPEKLKFREEEEAITSQLSYDQALAFYNWKYPIWKFNEYSRWTDFVFPSESEFKQVLKGENVYLQSENIQFPSLLFYYTIRVYQ